MKYLVCILLLLSACKEASNNKEIDTVIQVEFEENLKNKPKFFLKFWEGMSEDDYKRVTKILVDENVLNGEYPVAKYNIGNCEFILLSPKFDSKGLTEIGLPLTNCLYSIYDEKYNLPKLVKRTYLKDFLAAEQEWIEESVLKEIPTIIEKGKNLVFIDHEKHREYREYFPEQESNPSLNSTFGDMIVYYKTKNTYSKEQKAKAKIIKEHKRKVEKRIDSFDNRQKQALEEI
mgnify:CR=1 FL=1